MNKPIECSLKLLDFALMQFVGLVNWLMTSVASVVLMPVSLLALLLMLLSGCSSTDPAPQYLYRAVPQVWTDTITEPSLDGTYGAYIARCELFIKQCNADRESVRRWSDGAESADDGAPGSPE